MNITSQIHATVDRYNKRTAQRESNERLIREGRMLQADTPERVQRFLDRRAQGTLEGSVVPSEDTGDLRSRVNTLERVLGTNDLMGVAFLERGLIASRSVGRVWIGVRGGRLLGYGTGFLISPRLLLTNHHVLEDATMAANSVVELGYQVGPDGAIQKSSTFNLAADQFFFTDSHLDYSLVAVEPAAGLEAFGCLRLIEQEGKAIVAQWLNIIQHPNGEPKQLSLRENQFVDLLDEFMHYKTDTAPGSSGSPVFNDFWEVVALHHSGVPETNAAGQILAVDGSIWQQSMGEQRIKWKANEGVRISKIIQHLRAQTMTAAQRALLDQAWTATPNELVRDTSRATTPAQPPVPSGPSVAAIHDDGTATWTIPISVSVRIGGTAAASVPAAPAPGPQPQPITTPAPSPVSIADGTDDETKALAQAREQIGKRNDVLRVELGYVFKDGWITDERAIVVTVRNKLPLSDLREASIAPLPDRIAGYPVEVTTPRIEDVIARSAGATLAESTFRSPALRVEEITYKPPATPLRRVRATMGVTVYASPDNAWTQLAPFLGATRDSLTIGMFDFGAQHVVDAITGSRAKTMTLVMQRGESVGEGTKANDLTDQEVVDALADHFGNKFRHAWVRIGRVNGWVASSYHIKVAVRDRKSFWLSSGNLQSSNVPEGDPLGSNDLSFLREYNREWNAIVEHDGLAKTFEDYLLDDFNGNTGTSQEELALPDILVPASFFIPSVEERGAALRYFPPFTDRRAFTVTPVLTPDNYHQVVLDLVRGAKETLFIQNQTFNAPREDHAFLRKLIDAVIERHEAGVDVRVIFRLLMPSDARANVSALKEYGFPVSKVKIQKNCHTKGIIVDGRTLLLGSQNWSNDGVSLNRDASLLFEDEEVARYFTDIFEHDWNGLARQNIGSERFGAEIAPAAQATPEGMVRLSWKDYLEML